MATIPMSHESDHRWFQDKPRRLELESGETVLQRRCIICGRDFLIYQSSGDPWAVYVSAFSFHRLSEQVEQRWLSEPCPGKRLPSDVDDRTKRTTELRIAWQRSQESNPEQKLERRHIAQGRGLEHLHGACGPATRMAARSGGRSHT